MSDSSRVSTPLGMRKRHLLSTIESLVTRLLVSTKHLLELLTQWARLEADDKFVSDAYVKLGNDFRAATRAFTAAGVDIRDIGDVPQALRVILEAALLELPSQENLDRFLPNIRNLIVTLLQNLKAKQQKAKMLAHDREDDPSLPLAGHQTQASHPANHPPSHQGSHQTGHPPASGHSTPSQSNAPTPSGLLSRHLRKITAELLDFVRERTNLAATASPTRRGLGTLTTSSQPPSQALTPNPYQQQQHQIPSLDALTQLQKQNAMQRRASKRFLAYQMARLTQDSVKHQLFVEDDEPEARPRDFGRFGRTDEDPEPELEPEPAPEPTRRLRFSRFEPEKAPPVPEPVAVPDVAPGANDSASTITGTRSKRSSMAQLDDHLFLKMHGRTKKVPVTFPVTFALLRLLFVEKFAYSPGTSSFPEIYIRDPHLGVLYELEELMLGEVTLGRLLTLNEVDPNTAMIRDLLLKVSLLATKVDGVSSQVSRQVKEAVSALDLTPAAPMAPVAVALGDDKAAQAVLRELGLIGFELKALKQAQTKHKELVAAVVSGVTDTVAHLREAGLDQGALKLANRSYMELCHQKLSEESDVLLTKVDDLQDVMEALRKDVAQRGVRVPEKLLKHTMSEIGAAKKELLAMIDYIAREKLVWKKIWEQELDKVCEEQQFFNLQDDLTQDLDEDIKKIEETFALIEQCLTQQMKALSRRNKPVFVAPLIEPGETLQGVKDAVMSQVASLVPDHGLRVEAIEKAERLRERELQMNARSQFDEELGDFVGEKKFKKLGGFEEIERIRQQRNEENLRNGLGGI